MTTADETKPNPLPITLDAIVRQWAVERPDQRALFEAGRALTYAEMDERTQRMALGMRALGLAAGDRIAWVGKNSDLYFLLFYAAARVGIVMAPIGWRLAPPEQAWIINDTRARIVFLGEGFESASGAWIGQLDHAPTLMTDAQARGWIAGLAETVLSPDDAAGPDAAVLQLYTSGTTGNPKGAVLSNRNLFALRAARPDDAPAYMTVGADEAILVCMPVAHIGGTGLGIMALSAGVPAIILPEFNPSDVFDAVEQHGISRFFLVPAALHLLLQHPRCAAVDFSRIRYIIYGAAPIPLELLRAAMRVFDAQFIQAYGMTETTGTIVALPPEDHDPSGSTRMRAAGKALPGVELKVVDTEGQTLPVGEVGEIMTRSSNNMTGYWSLPEATRATMTDDGWVRTGDAGYLDADGYLFIHDRVKDMIISGGENVYPAEVESAIFGHPEVLEVAVFGVPDAAWGEAVKAAVVPKPGGSVDTDSVIAWARERIAPYKVPKTVDVIDALPRNASGKILRRQLRAPYWEGYDRQVN